LDEALLGLVPGHCGRRFDALAPERIEVPSGSRIAVDYSDPEKTRAGGPAARKSSGSPKRP
jgi:hypothetical protein